MRTLIDSGVCETIMSYAWIVHLGLKKRIDARDKGPKDLAAAMGDRIDFVGSIQLDVRIGEKKVAWKAWVARRLVVPFIVGTDTLDQKSMIDFRDHIWEYEGECQFKLRED